MPSIALPGYGSSFGIVPKYLRTSVVFVDFDAPIRTEDAGGVWYVATARAVDRQPGPLVWWEFSRKPFKTNMSRQECTSGWLGCSNGIDRDAAGRVRCTVRPDGSLRFRSVRD